MAASYYSVKYDTEASGPFVAEGANLTWSGGVGFIVKVVDLGTVGYLKIALVSGVAPTDAQVLTQGATTANADGAARLMLYPAYFREDVAVATGGITTWGGPALGATHSFFFDGQTVNVVATEILTFSGGQTCEVITVESDAGATGELSVRFISNLDDGLPVDNDTFTGDIAGDGTVNGVVHDRAYTPLHIHRLFADLNDDEDISGNDDISRISPTPSSKPTTLIIDLLGNASITDQLAQHMYGGSISQDSGGTLYAGVDIQVTSPNADTQPVLIQNDAIVTDYWKNAFMPDSVKGKVRILRKVRENGVGIDGQRVKGKLAEFGDTNFIAGTTLGPGFTALALVSSSDGNNTTDYATVAGAPYNTIVLTEGYQTIDYNNGNGATPYGLSIDFGSANSLQTYERTKYIGTRITAETLFGRSALLFDGINLNFLYDGESGGPFSEDEILAWGLAITYNAQTVNFTLGEVVTFSGGSRGRLIYMNDIGVSGTLIFDMDGNTAPVATETMTGLDSGGDGTVLTAVGSTSVAGTALLVALNDLGATGNLYCQQLTGITPGNNTVVYGSTSNASCAVDTTIQTRTINNQFWGLYTGTNHQTNFGLGLNATDGIVGDKFPNLLGVIQGPPDNRTGAVTSVLAGDTVTVYPWNGSATDINGDALPTFAEATLTTALVAGVSTAAIVSAIPDNTPPDGFLRIQRDSDGNTDLVQYDSYSGLTYQLTGTAPSAAGIGNEVMRAFVDVETITTQESFTAVYASPMQVAITVLNGNGAGQNGPIKPYKTTATFGAFSVAASRISDA